MILADFTGRDERKIAKASSDWLADHVLPTLHKNEWEVGSIGNQNVYPLSDGTFVTVASEFDADGYVSRQSVEEIDPRNAEFRGDKKKLDRAIEDALDYGDITEAAAERLSVMTKGRNMKRRRNDLEELDYEYGEWIPAHAVMFNDDGSVSIMDEGAQNSYDDKPFFDFGPTMYSVIRKVQIEAEDAGNKIALERALDAEDAWKDGLPQRAAILLRQAEELLRGKQNRARRLRR